MCATALSSYELSWLRACSTHPPRTHQTLSQQIAAVGNVAKEEGRELVTAADMQTGGESGDTEGDDAGTRTELQPTPQHREGWKG